MLTTRARARSLAAVFGIFLLVSGCSDSTNLIGPSNQLEVTNATDQFQFQVSALDKVTDSRTYTWQNTGGSATLDVSEEITGGSVVLTIRDADGQVVYDGNLAQSGNGTTSQGAPGSWTISVVLTEVTGTFNFRVQKAT